MCGAHIREVGDGEWIYPDHEVLLEKCELLPMDVYLERRRNTLHNHLTSNRSSLLRKAKDCGRHCKDHVKILWWDQPVHDSLV